MANASEKQEFSQRHQIEVTDEMVEAGAKALARWFGEPGESPHYLRRAAEEVFDAMRASSAFHSHAPHDEPEVAS